MRYKVKSPPLKASETWTITPEELDSISQQSDALSQIRGRIISSSITIEEYLDYLIVAVLFPNNPEGGSLFRELVLEREFFTFMNKWKTFKELVERGAIKIDDETSKKGILKKICDIIETRNKFAHGEVIFSGTTPELHYLKGGKKRSDVLDNTYFDGLNSLFSSTADILHGLSSKAQK